MRWTYPSPGWRKSKCSPPTNERLIELRIALESVLLSDDTGMSEKRYRLATRGAWLLGETFNQREIYFKTLSCVYGYASSVIHGGTPKVKEGRNLERDIASAQDLCRDAIFAIGRSQRDAEQRRLVRSDPRWGRDTPPSGPTSR